MRVAVFRTAAVAAFLVPVVQIPMLIWAREAFLDLHPAYLADPPTISRAISEPMVGVPFHNTIVLVTVLIGVALPCIIAAYWRSTALAGIVGVRRWLIRIGIVLACLSQIAAVAGMHMLTINTLAADGGMHMLGSYVFFTFQAVTIAIVATLCRVLLGHDREGWLLPSMQRLRFAMGMGVIALTLVYLALFVGKDHNTLFPPYAFQLVYVQCEVLVVSCFMLFLATYGLDLWALGRPRQTARLASPPPQGTAGGSPNE